MFSNRHFCSFDNEKNKGHASKSCKYILNSINDDWESGFLGIWEKENPSDFSSLSTTPIANGN